MSGFKTYFESDNIDKQISSVTSSIAQNTERFYNLIYDNILAVKGVTSYMPFLFDWKTDYMIEGMIQNSIAQRRQIGAFYAHRMITNRSDPHDNIHCYLEATDHTPVSPNYPFEIQITTPFSILTKTASNFDLIKNRIKTLDQLFTLIHHLRYTTTAFNLNQSKEKVLSSLKWPKIVQSYEYINDLENAAKKDPVVLCNFVEKHYPFEDKSALIMLKIRMGVPLKDDEMSDDILSGLV